jgi:hypothetical protein
MLNPYATGLLSSGHETAEYAFLVFVGMILDPGCDLGVRAYSGRVSYRPLKKVLHASRR